MDSIIFFLVKFFIRNNHTDYKLKIVKKKKKLGLIYQDFFYRSNINLHSALTYLCPFFNV